MPFIDVSYFLNPATLLVVDGNEDYLNACIETFEPDYLRAVLGESLYEAFMAGIETPTGVFFSDQFTDQFFKGDIDDRWNYIRDGHVFTYCGKKYRWVGLENASKRSPLANYVYWQSVSGRNPAPSPTGSFTVPKLENATLVPARVPAMRAWNSMVEDNQILRLMIKCLLDEDGVTLYPEFVEAELCAPDSYDVYHIQPLF